MFFRHNIFTIFFFTLIVIGCFLPGSSLPKAGAENLDKVIHIILFLCFSFSAMIGFVKQYQFPKLHFDAVKYVVGFAVFLAISTEVIQHFFIPKRTFDVLDIVADIVGVGIALIGFLLLKGREKCGI